jgi:hypothetical protein
MFTFSKIAVASISVISAFGVVEAFVPVGVLPGQLRSTSRNAASVGPVMQLSKARITELEKSKDLSQLFEGNEKWRQKQLAKDSEFFFKSAQGQKPRYLWIGRYLNAPEPLFPRLCHPAKKK